jgi:hypothetical protein
MIILFRGTDWSTYTNKHWTPFPFPFTTRSDMAEVFELPPHEIQSQSRSYIMTDGQSASLSSSQALI